MKIDIKRIAKLSRLTIRDDEIPRFETDMHNIVKMVDKLPDVTDVTLALDPNKPMTLREDEAVRTASREEILQNAPRVEAGCFVVPKVVEE